MRILILGNEQMQMPVYRMKFNICTCKVREGLVMHTYTHTNIHTYTDTHVHTRTHTHACIHTHIHT